MPPSWKTADRAGVVEPRAALRRSAALQEEYKRAVRWGPRGASPWTG